MAAALRLCASCKEPLTKARADKGFKRHVSCQSAFRKAQKHKAHDRRVAAFGLDPADYWKLYEAQAGRCAILNCRANGATKYLAVEHDHHCDRGHPANKCCRYCVRGLICGMHNGWIGKAADCPEVFDSLAAYLRDPPARKVLK